MRKQTKHDYFKVRLPQIDAQRIDIEKSKERQQNNEVAFLFPKWQSFTPAIISIIFKNFQY
jgi:putative NADPH-quinone reductase